MNWISVDERLPELLYVDESNNVAVSAWVWVWGPSLNTGGINGRYGFYDYSEHPYYGPGWCDGTWPLNKVTHWMPLPPPPEAT